MTNSINNDIPYVPENTIDPAAGLNLAIKVIDPLLQCHVISMLDDNPPSEPYEGDRYIVGATPSGDWAGHAYQLAQYLDSAWNFKDAWYVLNDADRMIWVKNGGSWYRVSAGTDAITGYVTVDMGSDDYTMTDDEAVAPFKLLSNVADGKTLTWPASAADRMPIRQVVVVGNGVHGLVFQSEGSFGIGVLTGQPVVQVSVLSGLAIFDECTKRSNYYEVSGATHTLTSVDAGCTFNFTNGAGCDVTIDGTCDELGFWVDCYQTGAGQVEFTSSSSLPIANIDGHTKTEGQYACVKLQRIGAGMLILSGRTGA